MQCGSALLDAVEVLPSSVCATSTPTSNLVLKILFGAGDVVEECDAVYTSWPLLHVRQRTAVQSFSRVDYCAIYARFGNWVAPWHGPLFLIYTWLVAPTQRIEVSCQVV